MVLNFLNILAAKWKYIKAKKKNKKKRMQYIFVNHPTISSNFVDSKLSKIHTYNLVTY